MIDSLFQQEEKEFQEIILLFKITIRVAVGPGATEIVMVIGITTIIMEVPQYGTPPPQMTSLSMCVSNSLCATEMTSLTNNCRRWQTEGHTNRAPTLKISQRPVTTGPANGPENRRTTPTSSSVLQYDVPSNTKPSYVMMLKGTPERASASVVAAAQPGLIPAQKAMPSAAEEGAVFANKGKDEAKKQKQNNNNNARQIVAQHAKTNKPKPTTEVNLLDFAKRKPKKAKKPKADDVQSTKKKEKNQDQLHQLGKRVIPASKVSKAMI